MLNLKLHTEMISPRLSQNRENRGFCVTHIRGMAMKELAMVYFYRRY